MELILNKLFFKFFKPRCLWHMRHYCSTNIQLGKEHNVYNITIKSKSNILKLALPSINSLKQSKSCETLAIIATGPSINTMNWATSTATDVALVNGAIKLVDSFSKENRTLYYLVTDPNFIEMNFHQIKKHFNPKINYLFSIRAFYEIAKMDLNFIKTNANQIYLVDQLHEPFEQPRRRLKELQKEPHKNYFFNEDLSCGFSDNPSLGLFNGGTVVYSMLQIAAFLNYSTLNIFGMDLGGKKRFYDEAKQCPSRLEEEYESLILPHMKVASDYFKLKNIKVINRSSSSRLPSEVFEVIDSTDF